MKTSIPQNLSHVSGQASFPRSKAFVVQFAADAGPQSGLFRGRVEHVTSGDQAQFGSPEELWDFVRPLMIDPSEAVPALRSAGGRR